MGKIIIKRLLQTIPTLLVVVTLTFCLTRMLPGDPAVAILGIEANAEDIEAMRAEMNLDKSLPEQYALYLGGLVHGDFGYSYSYRQDVLPLITSRIPNTLTLTLTALLFAFIIGTSVGIIAALKQNTIFDYIVMVITLIGVSMPIFWLALMLVLQFSVKMNLLPVMGMGDLSKGFGDVVSHMILPGFCLATIPMATFARTMRSSMIDIMSSDYIRCLRARGIKKLKVILIHGLKNALPPLITVLGLQIAGTFTGAIITEGIFSWPGMGTMINTAINNRDYSLIQGAVLFSAIMFVFCNMLVDIAYAILNPKVKLEKGVMSYDIIKKKKPAAASSVVSGEALGMDANIAMLVKERNANNAWHKLARNKTALVGFFIVAFMVVIAVFAPLIAPYDPNAINPVLPFKGIGTPGHLFGTDDLGRDILSRIIYGSRISMIVAVGATIVGAIIGVLIGLTAGYFGGWIDAVLMRIMDGMFSFPFILLAMILITVLGNGVMNVILAIGIASVPGFARVTRGQVLIVKEEEYCNACRVVGVSPVRLLFLHILPNCVSQIIVYATLRIASAIISEASLSFLGLGIALPTASWGSILRVGRDCLTTAPHVAGTAGAFILVTVIGFNLLGDGIRDVMDPKMKQ